MKLEILFIMMLKRTNIHDICLKDLIVMWQTWPDISIMKKDSKRLLYQPQSRDLPIVD